MSEIPTSATTTATPEQGTAVVDELVQVPVTPIDAVPEQAAAPKYVSPLERGLAIKALPSTVGSFKELLGAAPERDAANTSETLTESENSVFEYAVAQRYESLVYETVDHKAFEAKGAFGDNPIAGKTAYIIEDIQLALTEEQDPEKKKKLENSMTHMQNFAKVLDVKFDAPTTEDLQKFAKLTNDPNAKPEDVKAVQKELEAMRDYNFVKGAAYLVISQYFPSEEVKERRKANNQWAEGIVSMRPDKELGEYIAPVAEAPSVIDVLQAQKAAELEHKRSELKVMREIDKPGKVGVAVDIAKRENGHGLLNKRRSSNAKETQQLYSNESYALFTSEHGDGDKDNFQNLVDYVVADAKLLEKAVNDRRRKDIKADLSDPDQSIRSDLEDAIKEARGSLGDSYDERKVFNTLQAKIFRSFEEIIKTERMSKTRYKLQSKATDVAESERVRKAANKVGEKLKIERAKKIGRWLSKLPASNAARHQ